MRKDEDTGNALGSTVERRQVQEAIRVLGLDPEQVVSLEIEAYVLRVRTYAVDDPFRGDLVNEYEIKGNANPQGETQP